MKFLGWLVAAHVAVAASGAVRVQSTPLGFVAASGRVIGETAFVIPWSETGVHEIRLVPLTGGSTSRISTGDMLPIDFDFDGERLFVTGMVGEKTELHAISVITGELLARVAIDDAQRVRVRFERIFVGGRSEVTALALVAGKLKVTHRYPVHGLLSSFAFSGAKLVVIENYPGGFKVIDARSGSVQVERAVDPWLYKVAISGSLAFVEKMAIPSKMAGVIDVSDLEALAASEEPVRELDLDREVAPLAASETLLYVTKRFGEKSPVDALDPVTLEKRASFLLPVQAAAFGGEIQAQGNRLCVVGQSQIGCASVVP